MAEAYFHRDRDQRTHVERINPGSNPAHIPGMTANGIERARDTPAEPIAQPHLDPAALRSPTTERIAEVALSDL